MAGLSVPKDFYVVRCGNLYLTDYGYWSADIHKARATTTLKGAKSMLAHKGGFYEDDPLKFAIISQQDAVIEHHIVSVEIKDTTPLVVTIEPDKHPNGYFVYHITAKKKGEE